jgi:hypothetical protein
MAVTPSCRGDQPVANSVPNTQPLRFGLRPHSWLRRRFSHIPTRPRIDSSRLGSLGMGTNPCLPANRPNALQVILPSRVDAPELLGFA